VPGSLDLHALFAELPVRRATLLWTAGTGAATLATIFLVRTLRARKTPAEMERLRRLQINGIGRLTGGEIVNVIAEPEDAPLVVYSYEVSGVQYEASQDCSALTSYLDEHDCSPGLPASVKYDPANPGNSILLCETWSGLRS